jgi:hypothetical protein
MKIKAVCFDLGDTLIYSEQPLSWSDNYKNALEKGFNSINKKPTEEVLQDIKNNKIIDVIFYFPNNSFIKRLDSLAIYSGSS